MGLLASLRPVVVRLVRAPIRAWIALVLRLQGVPLGPGLRALSRPRIKREPGSHISIGRDCTIHNSSLQNVAGVLHRTSLATLAPGAAIEIGDRVGLSGAILVAMARIVIADDVMLGVNVRIYDNDFHPLNLADRLADVKDTIARSPVHIHAGAWIGADSLILKGVTIGEGAIIGAGSVVTRSVPARTVQAGNPARHVRNLD